MRRRFWAEFGAVIVSAALVVLTLVWRDWIEFVTGVDSDHHSGSLEWVVVAVACALSVGFSVTARLEWRRRLPVAAAGDARL